ncbi:metallophosphoesterase family protein [Chryseobacterium sp. S-02]|uniref:metallophosphoesterase family protein n=1 Tax=unclassified Chryseobacterium TaxID=2593645 RepID=UPI0028617127|nr:metallophosphoesterase family protein [Chryseobacterium sp. 2987]MDR6919940.1 putative phosphoesterase [Chryseobacterium sp. 2987]
MIQIAIISDIHGNIIALNTVLNDINQRKIDKIFCLGDLVDFAPWPNEVIDLIRSLGIPCILGNHDERIAFKQEILPIAHHSETETIARYEAINHTKNTITVKNIEWLQSLPSNILLSFNINYTKHKIMLVHGSINDNKEYIYEDHPNEEMLRYLRDHSVQVLVMGHTHLSYIKRINDFTLINAGSVGRSREEDRKATYCIISMDHNKIHSEIVKLDYNVEYVADEIKKSEIPSFYADFLLQIV